MPARRSLAIILLLAWTGCAQAADTPPYVVEPVSEEIDAACADPFMLSRIKERFAWAERRTWRRGYVLEALYNPRPSGHPYAEPGLISRDYCMAEAMMSNGDIRTLYYAIEHGVGFAGLGRYVDFCVLGLDPWHVHDGACRTVR
jgi:hypothetical protein